MGYNESLRTNNTNLRTILALANSLPENVSNVSTVGLTLQLDGINISGNIYYTGVVDGVIQAVTKSIEEETLRVLKDSIVSIYCNNKDIPITLDTSSANNSEELLYLSVTESFSLWNSRIKDNTTVILTGDKELIYDVTQVDDTLVINSGVTVTQVDDTLIIS